LFFAESIKKSHEFRENRKTKREDEERFLSSTKLCPQTSHEGGKKKGHNNKLLLEYMKLPLALEPSSLHVHKFPRNKH